MEQFLPSAFQILMVDDNPKNLQLLGSTLRNEGYYLEFATNGQMALNWLEKKKFDLILLDIMMPGMSGFEVAETLKNNPLLNDIPIIYLTAKTDKTSILQAFKTGARDYITKPFESAELLARVRTHLELRHSQNLLKELNKNLESKVQERTLELKEANDNLFKANNELTNLDTAKTEFLHIIAHEIRTPLNGIKGSLEIIKEFQSNDSIKTLVEILDASVERLEKFSINALKITQLRLGNFPFDKQQLSLKQIINTSHHKIIHHKKEKELQYKIEIPEDDYYVMGDLNLLTNCLIIILDNAVNFSPKKGEITISAKANCKCISIDINDQGVGFSVKALENLFRLFSPGEKHINENEGLELALAKMIIDAHDGKIEIKNLNPGASVSVILPLLPKN